MLERCACPAITFSEKAGDLTAGDISLTSAGVAFTAEYKGGSVPVKLGIPGLFSVYNALGVIGAGLALGISLADCADSLASGKGVKGRVEVVPRTATTPYSSTTPTRPTRSRNVLRSMRAVTRGRLVALFGCGGDRDRTKRPIMGRIAAENADFVVVTRITPARRTPRPS